MSRGVILGCSHTTVNAAGGPLWPALVAQDLRSIDLLNLGLSGTNTGHWLGTTPYNFGPSFPTYTDVYAERLAVEPRFPFDLALITVGTNDNWLEFGQYEVRLPLLIQKLLDDGTGEVQVLQPILQATWGAPGYPETWSGFNFNLAQKLVELDVIRGQTQGICDQFDRRVRCIPTPAGMTLAHFGPPEGDHLHMVNAGHRKIQKTVTQALRSSTFHFPGGGGGAGAIR